MKLSKVLHFIYVFKAITRAEREKEREIIHCTCQHICDMVVYCVGL